MSSPWGASRGLRPPLRGPFHGRATGFQHLPEPGLSLACGQPLLCRGGTRLPARSASGRRGVAPNKPLTDQSLRSSSSVKTCRLPHQAAPGPGPRPPPQRLRTDNSADAPGLSARPDEAAPPTGPSGLLQRCLTRALVGVLRIAPTASHSAAHPGIRPRKKSPGKSARAKRGNTHMKRRKPPHTTR